MKLRVKPKYDTNRRIRKSKLCWITLNDGATWTGFSWGQIFRSKQKAKHMANRFNDQTSNINE